MDIIYKVFIGMISVLILVASGYAIITNLSTEISVNNYFESVTQTVIESDYNEEVIENCIREATLYGYELTVEVHGADTFGVKKYAEMKLSYTSRIPLLGVSMDKVKQKVI